MVKNCLFCGVNKEGLYSVKTVQQIVDQIKIENAYAVFSEDIRSSLYMFKQGIDFWYIIYGNYDSYMHLSPVDRNFRNPIPEFTEEILQIMDRSGRAIMEKKIDMLYRF